MVAEGGVRVGWDLCVRAPRLPADGRTTRAGRIVGPVTSIFAQRDDPTEPTTGSRPIGVLGDVDLIVYTQGARLLGRKARGAFRRGVDDARDLRELRALELHDVTAWPNDEERPSPGPDASLAPAEILAFELVERSVAASLGGRPRFQHALVMGLGPYHVQGDIRVRPGGDPVAAFARSSGLVVLRDAWIEYPAGPGRRRRLARRLVVNRDLARSVGLAADMELDIHEDRGRLSALFREVRRDARR